MTCGKPRAPIWAHVAELEEKSSDNKSVWKCNYCSHKRTVGEGKRPPASCWYEHLVLKCEGCPESVKITLAAKGDTAKLNEWKRKRNEEMLLNTSGVGSPSASVATAAAVAALTGGTEPLPLSKRYKASLAASDPKLSQSDDELVRVALVQNWLTSALPQLYPDDAVAYARAFVREGFDSNHMLDNVLIGDDLGFMKKAHRRALIQAKNLKESSPISSAEEAPADGEIKSEEEEKDTTEPVSEGKAEV